MKKFLKIIFFTFLVFNKVTAQKTDQQNALSAVQDGHVISKVMYQLIKSANDNFKLNTGDLKRKINDSISIYRVRDINMKASAQYILIEKNKPAVYLAYFNYSSNNPTLFMSALFGSENIKTSNDNNKDLEAEKTSGNQITVKIKYKGKYMAVYNTTVTDRSGLLIISSDLATSVAAIKDGPDLNLNKTPYANICYAIAALDEEGVKDFIANGDNLNDTYEYTDFVKDESHLKTPLELAIKFRDDATFLDTAELRKRFNIIKQLTESGADVNLKDAKSETPLLWASTLGETSTYNQINCRTFYEDVVLLLLQKGASPNVVRSDHTSPLWYAVVQTDLRLVKMLLNAHVDKVSKGYSALEQAKSGVDTFKKISRKDHSQWARQKYEDAKVILELLQ